MDVAPAYPPAAFRDGDPESLWELIASDPLAALVARRDGSFVIAHVPLLADTAGGRLLGHVARANPLADGPEGEPVVALFQGPQAYVSPGWYPTKREMGRAVPTWTKTAVHVHGRLTCLHHPAEKRAIVAAIKDRHEAGRPQPWSLADAPADNLARMLDGIVGIALAVTRLEGVAKLSQNQPDRNRASVQAALAASDDPQDRAVAARMAAQTSDRARG